MKTWTDASILELDVQETAFGIENPNTPDSEKTQVQIDGKWGYQQLYGEGNSSNNSAKPSEL